MHLPTLLADVSPADFADHKAWAELITTVLGALTAAAGLVALLCKPFRAFIQRKTAGLWQFIKDVAAIFIAPKELRLHVKIAKAERLAHAKDQEKILAALGRLETTTTGLKVDVDNVTAKLNNGISSHLKAIAAMSRHTFQESAAPQFICNRRGENLNVSYAYRRLLGTTGETDLLGLNWKLFARKDSDGYERYWRGFLDAASTNSNFSGTLRLWCYDHRGELQDVGEWDINLTIVSDHGTTIGGDMEAFYIGRLVARDAASKAHQGRALRKLDTGAPTP